MRTNNIIFKYVYPIMILHEVKLCFCIVEFGILYIIYLASVLLVALFMKQRQILKLFIRSS